MSGSKDVLSQIRGLHLSVVRVLPRFVFERTCSLCHRTDTFTRTTYLHRIGRAKARSRRQELPFAGDAGVGASGNVDVGASGSAASGLEACACPAESPFVCFACRRWGHPRLIATGPRVHQHRSCRVAPRLCLSLPGEQNQRGATVLEGPSAERPFQALAAEAVVAAPHRGVPGIPPFRLRCRVGRRLPIARRRRLPAGALAARACFPSLGCGVVRVHARVGGVAIFF